MATDTIFMSDDLRDELHAFVDGISDFSKTPSGRQNDYIFYFATIERQLPTASPAQIAKMREALQLPPSKIDRQLREGAQGRNAKYVRVKSGYVLSRGLREELDAFFRVNAANPPRAVTPPRRKPTAQRKRPVAPPSDIQIFIGSSVEGKAVAEAIQVNLDHDFETTIWTQSVFSPAATTIESLFEASEKATHAILVLTPDDETNKRGDNKPAPRDNVIFEAGFFMGRLGRLRTFIVKPRGVDLSIPTDFLGITLADYAVRENISAAVGAACTKIKEAIKKDSKDQS